VPKIKIKPIHVKIPNQIRRYRKQRHFKLKDVALLMGLKSQSNLSHLESGRKLASLVTALKLSAVLKCPVEFLYSDIFNSIRKEVLERKQKFNLFETYG